MYTNVQVYSMDDCRGFELEVFEVLKLDILGIEVNRLLPVQKIVLPGLVSFGDRISRS